MLVKLHRVFKSDYLFCDFIAHFRKFFQTLPCFGSTEVASSLLSGILERAVLLYGPSDYTSSIRR